MTHRIELTQLQTHDGEWTWYASVVEEGRAWAGPPAAEPYGALANLAGYMHGELMRVLNELERIVK